ncbi:MAG TPA: alcohol dehydrogenase catalytic domain-containing protein [Anaerolineae bacterium]|nr:alcohol dehydrogenase catalytic domain-containing protein [Anaerolineae bacterium]
MEISTQLNNGSPTTTATVTAARLHGPSDLRVEEVPHPGPPGPDQVLLRVTAVGICGSDLHTYKDGRIGDNVIESPLTLGHEFAGIIEAVGEEAMGGDFQPLHPGMRVAVDPAQPCWHCEMCELGHPNLCYHLHFCGSYPDEGSLVQWMHMPARTCFPVPDSIDDMGAALLEPLGIAVHAVDLAKIRVADSVAILGAGCIGLSILELVKLSGAQPIFVSDKFPWRLAVAEQLGAIPINCDQVDPAKVVLDATAGRGVDVVIEAAWADHSVQQAADMARMGGRMVIVGISEADELRMKHSTVRRKGLTIRLARRMKHTYPRSIKLMAGGAVDFGPMVSHRFPLEQAPEAFAMNTAYQDNVIKVIIDVS